MEEMALLLNMFSCHVCCRTAGACTMMVAEQIQDYRISFELTKPNQALLVP